MKDLFKKRYSIESTRAQWWNYGNQASYFITICTKNWECFFGEIAGRVMHLSEMGEIVNFEWLSTMNMRPDMNLSFGEYVVMPNHFHAIITIGKNVYNSPG